MGDAYRGLTIRIGADTSPLERSMKGLDKTARQLQSSFRAASKAFRVDGDIAMQRQQMRLLCQQAETSSARLARLTQAERQASAQSRALATSTRNAALQEARFGNALTSTNATLESFYESWARATSGMSSGKAFDTQLAKIKEITHAYNAGATSYREFANAVRSGVMKSGFDDPFGLGRGVKGANEYVSAMKRLNAEWNRLSKGKRDMGGAADVQRARSQMELLRAEIRSTTAEEVKLDAKMRQLGTGHFREAAADIEVFDSSISQLKANASTLDKVLRLDPGNFDAAAAKLRSVSQAAEMAEMKAKELEKRTKMTSAGEIDSVIQKYKSTARAVELVSRDLTEAKVRAESLDGQLSQARENLRTLRMTGTAQDIAEARIEVKVLENGAKAAKREVRVLGTEFDRVNRAHAGREAGIELAYAKSEATQLKTALDGAGISGRKLAQIGSSIKTLGYSLSATIGSGAMMAGMYAIQAAKDIDSAYRDMRKTVNGTEEEFEHLRQSALDFSMTHFTSADQILSIEAIGGQLGIAAGNLEKFGEVVSNLDIATNVDTETMAQNLGQLSNIMNDMDQDLQSGPGSFEAYSDALVRLGNNSAAQEDKIQNVMMRIASMGTISGMSTPDLLALSTAVAATGQGAEAAGTAVSKTFSNIEGAVNGGDAALEKIRNSSGLTEDEMEELSQSVESGMEKLQAFADVAGMSSEEFKQAWNNDPTEAFKAFIGGLKRIDQEGGSVDSTLKSLGINSVRQKQTLNGLVQTFDVLNDSLLMSNNAWNGIGDVWGDAGDAAREAQRKSEGFSGQWQQMTNSAKVLGTEVTDSLTPAVAFAADAIAGLATGFSGLPDAAKLAVSAIGLLTAGTGPMSIFIGGAIDGFSSINNALFGNKDAYTKLSIAQKKYGSELIDDAAIAALASGRFERLGKKVSDAGSKMTKANGEASKLGRGISSMGAGISALAPGKMLGITAAIAGVATVAGICVDQYSKMKERTETVAKANETMADRVRRALVSTTEGIDAEKLGSESYESFTKFYDEYMEKLAESNEQLSNSWNQTLGKNASIEAYAGRISDTIAEFSQGAKISEARFASLKAEVDAYNRATGSSIEVTREEDGTLRVLADGAEQTADSFKMLADAKKLANISEHYGNEASGASQAKEDVLAQIQKQKADMQKLIGEYASDGVVTEEERYSILMLSDSLSKLNEEYVKQYTSEQSALQMSAMLTSSEASQAGTLQSLIAHHEGLRSSFAASKTGCLDFIDAIGNAGISADMFAGKEDLLATAITNWDGTTNGLIDSLRNAGIALDETQERLVRFSTFQIEDKTFHLKDDGTVVDEEGKLHAIDSIQIGDKTYHISSDGTVRDENNEVVEFTTNVEEVPDEMKITAVAETETAKKAIDELNAAAQSRTVTITYQTAGSAAAPTATGGMLPNARMIRHANGGYFVDRPTVIGRTGNVTHIAGEAGREYVSMNAKGGVVLPLSNPYMRPWVRAVADQMGGTTTNNIRVVLQYDASSSAKDMARDFTRALEMEGLMR